MTPIEAINNVAKAYQDLAFVLLAVADKTVGVPAGQAKICSNRYVLDETFTKLFAMSWNEIVDYQLDYQERWQENIRGDDVLLRYKTRLVMQHVAAGPIKEFDLKLMLAVMDYIMVFEDGRLQIKFYDETEFEVETE